MDKAIAGGPNSIPFSWLVEVTPTRMVYSGPEWDVLPEYPNTQIPEWNILPDYLAHEGEIPFRL